MIFIAAMLSLVWLASRQNNQLITNKYYENELAFQEVRKKQEHTAKLNTQLKWTLKDNLLLLDFPEEAGSSFSGSLYFYKPSEESDDRMQSFKTDNDSLVIDISELASGMFTLKVDWQAGGVSYYNEGTLILP